MTILADIERKIRQDFGDDKASVILEKLEHFERRFLEVYKEKPGYRILRCIIQLSSGNEDVLDKMIDAALGDWRDVIYWAEYNKRDERVFRGSRRFTFT